MGGRFLGLLALAALASCATPKLRPEDYGQSPERIAALPEPARDDLQRARRALDGGDVGVARAILDALRAARPDDVETAVMLQELTLRLSSEPERAALLARARADATSQPTLVHLLLAARIEPVAADARAWIDRALLLEPRSAWVHYAAAHGSARQGDWAAAQQSVAEALRIDPGHRAARRLEAAILARAGENEKAQQALEVWLAVTADDPRIDGRARALAQLDLAHLYLLTEEEGKARKLLLQLASSPVDEVRRLCLLAAVEQALGRPAEALADALAAQKAAPGAMTPLVQEALLKQHDLKDPAAAREAWQRVLAATKGDAGLGALIQGLRARVVLERAEAVQP